MFDVDKLALRLSELRSERATVASLRSKEEMRALVEVALGRASARVAGSTGFLVNGHVDAASLDAADMEYRLSEPGLREFHVARAEAMAELTNRQRDTKLKRLDAEIAKLEAEQLRHAKAAALDEVERKFGGVAA
jgi:hypothetical protein